MFEMNVSYKIVYSLKNLVISLVFLTHTHKKRSQAYYLY